MKVTVIDPVVPLVAVTVGALALERAVPATTNVNVAVGEPVIPFAVIVNVVEERKAAGVPETVPVLVLRVNPDGSEGEIEYEVGVPPNGVLVKLVIAAPLTAEIEFVERVRLVTAAEAADSELLLPIPLETAK